MTYNPLNRTEEGTFTPFFTNGTNNATMSIQIGTYKKIGNWVFIKGRVKASALGSMTSGQLRIGGLPFTASATTDSFSSIHCGFGGGLALTAGWNCSGYVQPNDTYISLQVWQTTTGTSAMTPTQLSADGGVFFSGFYYVD